MKTKGISLLKAAIFALILSMSSVYVINAQNIDDLDAAIERGQQAAESGEYDRAIREYTEVIRLINVKRTNNTSSRNAPLFDRMLGIAYDSRSLLYFEKNDYDRTIADCTEAIKFVMDDKEDVFLRRGRSYSEKEDYDRAIADFTQVIKLNSKNTSAYFHRGNAYYFKGDPSRAIADWEALLRIDPNNAAAKRNIGIVRNN
jgi:tetratricopeptide (TPR) repeat protein